MNMPNLHSNLEQLDSANVVTAVVATTIEHPKHKVISMPSLGGYGISLLQNGQETVHWGAGCARSQFPFIAWGILHLLEIVPDGKKLVVHAEAGLMQRIGPTGFIRKVMERKPTKGKRKHYEGYKPLTTIIKRMDEGAWQFIPYLKKDRPSGFKSALAAAQVGRQHAQEKVIEFMGAIDGVSNNPYLFATDENPDLLGVGIT